MIPFSKLLAPVMMCTFAFQALAQPHPSEDPHRVLDDLVPRLLEEHDVPSAAVAYIENAEIAFTKVWGEQAPGVPATPRTLYNVASLTKPVVAETVLRLVDAGKLFLDEPLAPHWVDPDVAADPRSQMLTPRIVLSHETGLPNWRYETEDVLRFLQAPGERAGYSGEGFEWLAKAVENKLGVPFEDLARAYVLEPAKMKSTAFVRQPWFEGRLAEPYMEGRDLRNVVREDFLAADDMRTTVGDYARFLVHLMKGGDVSPKLASERLRIGRHFSWIEACATQAESEPPCPKSMGWTTGWLLFDYGEERIVYHDGGDLGEKTLAFYSPEREEGVVVFTNGANGAEVMFDIAAVLYDNEDWLTIMSPPEG